jgi:DNA-binding GntR family transcriptional regulator
MRALQSQPSLVQRVFEAIVSEIVGGGLASGARLIQDDLARTLGVSRQPVQQALLLLRNQGLVKDAPGRGLIVAPLEPAQVRDLYQMRAAMEALAARLAAERGAPSLRRAGEALIARGRAALQRGSLADQIAADIEFHCLIAAESGNALLSETMAPHWPKFRRIMAEVLREGEQKSRRIWEEHAAILSAIVADERDRAEALCREHLAKASILVVDRIVEPQNGADDSSRDEKTPVPA